MRLLLTPGKRLWDAVTAFVVVLFGRATTKKLTATQRVKHAAALQNDLLEVASLLEKMHAWTSRMAARDSRAAKRILDSEEAPAVGASPAATAPLTGRDRKALLRRYWTAQSLGLPGVPPPPPAAAPEQLELADANGDDPVTVEDEP